MSSMSGRKRSAREALSPSHQQQQHQQRPLHEPPTEELAASMEVEMKDVDDSEEEIDSAMQHKSGDSSHNDHLIRMEAEPRSETNEAMPSNAEISSVSKRMRMSSPTPHHLHQ